MNVRRPTAADAPGVTELIAAMDIHFVGAPELTEEDLHDEWNDLELDRDAWLFELDGELAGYSVLHTGAHVFADGYVHPRHFGRGVGTRIVELTEEEARSRKLQAIRNAVLAADVHARALLESRGYRALRHFYRMAIELDGPPPPAEWPPGLRAEPVDYEHEAEAFHATLDEAFAEEFGHEPESGIDWRARRERRSFDPTLWFVVKEGDEVAAALLCAERFGSGWIASIGVRKPWRRRGLGFALLLHGFDQLYARGQHRIALGVDAENPTGATRLYERAGMHQAFEAVVYEKPLPL
jgi:ribosomal protein S18 acetylase RimI-like enzyme